jgi:putative ATP-dependent endonuclease of OLD family
MYLKTLKIWNFRSIGSEGNKPGLTIDFDPKFNLLIGPNDSGKTAVIDAIRYCLGTQTYDPIRLEVEDFYQNPETKQRSTDLRIECIFDGFTDEEAGQFLEWININKEKNFELKVWFTANIKDNRIITNLKAGIDDEGLFIDGGARDLLRVTYLKPLRDAEAELAPGYRSRLYQILKSHQIFKKTKNDDKHPLEKYFDKANEWVAEFFNKEKLERNDELNISGEEVGGKTIKESFKNQTKDFLEQKDERSPEIKITPTELNSILRKLELILEGNKSGLGTLNLLYMAAELLHLKREDYLGLRLALIEELEAHLHPQAQLRVIKSLINEKNNNVQYIFTTHSTLLGSSIPLKHLKLCSQGNVYSLDSNSTALSESDYQFLERFLDATKANLFFAKGVIIVEGDAENIIIPTLAEILDRPLHKYGVSIVNVGSKALLRYSNIFKRKDCVTLPIKVAIVTDLDLKMYDNGNPTQNVEEERQKLRTKYDCGENIKAFISPIKTLEFDIAKGNLSEYIYWAIQIAKKIKANDEWISCQELRDIMKNRLTESDVGKRAKIIYEPLEKSQTSKTVTAQWFARLIVKNKKDVFEKIKKDYESNSGIKYLIEAIEHVTEKINCDKNDNH